MEHIFIINPAAGPTDSTRLIQEAISKSAYSENCEIYLTKGPGDATAYIKNKCSQCSEPLRFYACGGDGTLNEVVNGAVNYTNAAVGCYPCGSGNDFVKYYGGAEGFLNIDKLICGEEHPIDLILSDGKYCINVLNFGFDTAVLKTMEKVKTNWLFHGKRAYFAGVITALLKSMKTPCKVTVDGEVISGENILLCTISNGRYVGSSFQCAPRSLNDDGLLEVCLVKPFSRLTFVQLMSDYSKGLHLDNPKFKDYIVYRRGKQITVEGGNDFAVALDGELVHNSTANITVVEKAIKFVVPLGIGVTRENTLLTANK